MMTRLGKAILVLTASGIAGCVAYEPGPIYGDPQYGYYNQGYNRYPAYQSYAPAPVVVAPPWFGFSIGDRGGDSWHHHGHRDGRGR